MVGLLQQNQHVLVVLKKAYNVHLGAVKSRRRLQARGVKSLEALKVQACHLFTPSTCTKIDHIAGWGMAIGEAGFARWSQEYVLFISLCITGS